MKLTSVVFNHYGSLISRYTCDGKNVSPSLEWSEVPSSNSTFALIMNDPDAPTGTWNHWIIFNLPHNLTSLPEEVKQFPPGTKFEKNSWGETWSIKAETTLISLYARPGQKIVWSP